MLSNHEILRYVKGKLPQNKPSTIGVEFATKNVELKNNAGIVKAQIWDTGKPLNNDDLAAG